MKSTIFVASIALLATAVVADDSSDPVMSVSSPDPSTDTSCWMTLGQYSPGGTYCAPYLPDFTDQQGCQTSQAQCTQEYTDCKATTQSTSACLTLMSFCQKMTKFCNNQCAPNSDGSTSSDCNFSTVNAWNGVQSDTVDATTAPAPVVQVPISTTAPIPTTSAYVAPTTSAYRAPSTSAYRAPTTVAVYRASSTTSKASSYTSSSVQWPAPNVPCGTCYNDFARARGLSVQKYAPFGTGMTIQLCQKLCSGYKYTGLQYASECFCGNELRNNIQPASGCNMHCFGDRSQTCGGNLMMNIYQKGCAAPASSYSSKAAYVAPAYSSTSKAAVYGYNTPSSTKAAYVAPVYSSTKAAYVAPVYSSTKAAYVAPAYTSAKAYSTTPTAAKTTPTVGVCAIPSAYTKPIGGYHAPIVACNVDSDYTSSPWKLYTSHSTSTCPSYSQGNTAKACNDACLKQYDNCVKNYANSLSTHSSYSGYKVRRSVAARNVKRTWWMYGTPSTNTYASSSDTYSTAMSKCSSQKAACISANQNHVVSGTCLSGGTFRANSYGSSSNYNTEYSKYGSVYGTSSYGSYNSASGYGGSTTDNDDYW